MEQFDLTQFSLFYLYGFSNNPNQTSSDYSRFNQLYQLVIGQVGGVSITHSFHPYYIINPKGLTVWADAYLKLHVNNEKDQVFSNIRNNAVYTVNTSSAFNARHIWADTRLTYEENPVFSKYVPFIIPFLVQDTKKPLNWDREIHAGMATNGNAYEYVEEVTNAIRFFMPPPAFIMGFDEFDATNPSKLIDRFIACKRLLGACNSITEQIPYR